MAQHLADHGQGKFVALEQLALAEAGSADICGSGVMVLARALARP